MTDLKDTPESAPGDDDDAISIVSESWWLASLGRTIVWARLRVRGAGTADIFDSDGNTLVYDSEDTARAMLLDADFIALDGIDEDDALERGFALHELEPPKARDDQQLRERMLVSLGERA